MRSGVRIARLFGISIFIDWSWLLIFLLVTWNLASSVFPSLHPAWSTALNWGMGILASGLFFASVLAHELAHSLMAGARGLPVRRITLFIFGGISNIEREPPSPATEFLVTIVGPATSIVLGVVFSVLGSALAGGPLTPGTVGAVLAQLSPLPTLLLWLGPINIVLGLFNLIPGFPLDGGRVLRSVLWAMSGNLRRATRWATGVGQAVAWLFIFGGVAMIFGFELPYFGSGLIGGLWLAVIGWFLNNAAVQSYEHVVVEDMLEGIPVARLMQANAPVVRPDIPISTLVDDFLMKTDERGFAVVEGDRLVGMVCLEDVRAVPRAQWETTPVRQVMTPASDITVVGPREDATEALNKLATRDVRQMPVIEAGRLVGMLRRRDILRWLQLQSHHAPAR